MARARRRTPPPGGSAAPGGLGRDHWRADGRAKTRFESEGEANRAALQLRLEEGVDLDPYPCTWCGGWHLGNRDGAPPARRGDRR